MTLANVAGESSSSDDDDEEEVQDDDSAVESVGSSIRLEVVRGSFRRWTRRSGASAANRIG